MQVTNMFYDNAQSHYEHISRLMQCATHIEPSICARNNVQLAFGVQVRVLMPTMHVYVELLS